MHKLVVYTQFDPKARMINREIRGNFEFEEQSAAELRALLYLNYCPNDIVMLVTDLEKGTCKHCGEEIKENAGWIIHRWVHVKTGAYACLQTSGATKAEPKEML